MYIILEKVKIKRNDLL